MADRTHRSVHREHNSLKHADSQHYDRQVDGPANYRPQVDGAKRISAPPALSRTFPQQQHQHQASSRNTTQTASRQHDQVPRNVVTDILPYCTTELPLTQEQVIALSDVAGSVKELALLALSASAGDCVSIETLHAAVGTATANNIVDFFVDEWEVEG
ncbi:hypothetical protein IQ06DRAFT_13004 [Phaeosphaeriaceae sp. SRC1lsM3a]|nr:hypothetical protein IQ06DRAFT_13004 [Stagonospora sp. SRC1lsM3a]